MLRQLVIAMTLALTAGFAPAAAPVQTRRTAASSIVMSEAPQGRRAALSTLGLAALTLPLVAHADSIEEIAARSNAKAKAEAEAKAAAGPIEEPDNSSSAGLIGAIAVGGTLASTAFYSQNLKRVGEKITTGKGRKY